MTENTRARPASPSCTAALSEPSARSGWDAMSRAATNPVKLPTVLLPVAARQPAKPITAATAAPPSTSSIGSTAERVRVMRIRARLSWPNTSPARALSTASSR